MEMPLPLAGERVEADQRFSEEIRPQAPTAPVVAARRACRHLKKPAHDIERHQLPHICVASLAPRLVLPPIRAEIVARLRVREENPAALAGSDVNCLYRSGRVKLAPDPVGYAAPYAHWLIEYDRRRGLIEFGSGHRTTMSVRKRNASILAIVRVSLTGRGC
ncbi:MAG: hypothetical protein OXI87_12255 [Albidovulum sp.]|nr:hypothetical protein [Albidovulum sp.]MDE0305632.1 hypothetical protein [Albidovulum sp.]